MLSRLLLNHLLYLFVSGVVLPAYAVGPVASTGSLTYQGRILRSDGMPFENKNVSFVFQILDPGGQCVIYQEQVNGINMENSKGVFDVPIGTGSVQYITGLGASTVVDIFNNDSGMGYFCGACSSSGSSYNCSATTTPYHPIATAGRLLRVAFYDGTGWKTVTPDNEIRTVPYAGYATSAQKLGKNSVNDFVLKNEINNSGAGSVNCDSGSFLTWDANTMKFGCGSVSGASGGTVTSVLTGTGLTGGPITDSGTISLSTSGVTAGTYGSAIQMPVIEVDSYGRVINASQTSITGFVPYSSLPACNSAAHTLSFISPIGGFSCTPISITLSGDVSGSQGTAVVEALQGTPVASSAPTNNQVLQFDGAQWKPTTLSLAASDLTSLSGTGIVKRTGASAFTTLGVSAPLADLGTSIGLSLSTGLKLNSNSLAVDVGTGANQIPQLDGSGKISTSVIPSGVSSQWMTSGSNISYSGGNVGIGTIYPASSLHVKSSGQVVTTFESTDANYMGIHLKSGSTTNPPSIYASGNGMSLYTMGTERVGLHSNGNVILATAAGSVGIGTPNPQGTLHVASGNVYFGDALTPTPSVQTKMTVVDSNPIITVAASNAGGSAGIEFQPKGMGLLGGQYKIFGSPSAGPYGNGLIFELGNLGTMGGGQFVMRLDSNGYLSLGQGLAMESAAARLHVKGIGALVDPSPFGSNPSGTVQRIEGTNTVLDAGFSTTENPWLQARTKTDYSLSKALLLNPAGGNVGIGTVAPAYALHVAGASGATVGFFTDGTASCSIRPATAGSVSCSSDERLKKNVTGFSDATSLENILKLNTVTYEWRSVDNGRHTGYIAQEVEKIAPEFVTTGNDGYKQVSYSGFIPWITGAIKELNKKLMLGMASKADKEMVENKIQTLELEVLAKDLKIKMLEEENLQIKARLEKIEKALGAR
ncbi:tail fiber domain-containing protein [Bdellovibrio sp. HCB117]|uniref:tail fiber domain-containing protein n=1 Tax=Bdellovibrio sp. HCB117 TaxID=3394359 RepID=UPI0039B43099